MSQMNASDVDDTKDEEPKRLEPGYIKVTQSGENPQKYWAVFIVKLNQLYLYRNKADISDPAEIIHLSTCSIRDTVDGKVSISLFDECTGITYTIEPYEDKYPNCSYFQKMNLFMQEWITDLVFNTDLSARQQFNRFLKHQSQVAKEQNKNIPRLVNAVKKCDKPDKALCDALTWFQQKQLDAEDREVFGNALAIRNMFWNLLLETRNFINTDYRSSAKIIGVLYRWEKIADKNDVLTDKDKKVLIYGLKELCKFTTEDKKERAEDLKDKWETFGQKIVEMNTQLQRLQKKWQDKVDEAKKMAEICYWVGGVLSVVGAAVVLAVAIPSVPIWVAGIGAGVIAAGAGVAYYGYKKQKDVKAIKEKMDGISHIVKSYGDIAQRWIEDSTDLEIPLSYFATGDATQIQSEINSWEQLSNHEKQILKNAQRCFGIFSEQTAQALDKIRKIQKNTQMRI